jgi:hypothetical protein
MQPGSRLTLLPEPATDQTTELDVTWVTARGLRRARRQRFRYY